MVRSHRPHRSKLGLVAGLLLLGVAIALVLASGLLMGLRIVTALNAFLVVFLPGVTLAAAAGGMVWLHRSRRADRRPPAQVRWDAQMESAQWWANPPSHRLPADAQMAQPRPPVNQRYTGRYPVPARNEAADRWERRS